MAQEAALPDLFDALRWRWPLALAIAIGLCIGATIYVEALPDEYEATSVVAFAPRPEVPSAGADTVRLVAPKYVAFLVSPQTTETVAGEIGVELEALDDALQADVTPDTGNLNIAVTSLDPEIATEAANTYAAEAVTLSQSDKLVSADVVAEALEPTRPSGPPRRLYEAAALVVGALLGIAVALLVERARPRIRSWRDIYQLTGFTVLGRIPRAAVLRRDPREALAHPIVGSSFRTLRTTVERRSEENEVQVLAITSATSGDGKTTTAALFAESLARLGNKVLLIDADMRRAGLTKTFARGLRAADLASVLTGRSSIAETVQRAHVPGLDLLPTRPTTDAGDLLAKRFGELLTEVRKRYDMVVIDTAPLVGTDEGRTVVSHADGVLLVVRAGSMSGPVTESVLALEAVKAPVLGAVGNRLRRSEIGQYYA